MTLQLTDVLQDLFTSLGIGKVHQVTSTGTTTTTIDTTETDGVDEGSIIVVSDTGGVAPEGEIGRITAFDPTTNKWTHDAFTAATVALDRVLICRNDLKLFDAIEVVNRGLRRLGDLDNVDTTTLDTATGQTEYAAAVEWKRRKPTKIEIQTKIDDSNDNKPMVIHDWDYRPASANSTGLIIFNSQPVASRDLYIWYRDVHPRVSTFSAYIREELHPELVRQAVLLEALEYIISETGRGTDPQLKEDRNKAAVELDRAMARLPIYREQQRGKLNIVS